MTHRSCLAGVAVGEGVDVVIVGALNVSPESFYRGSVVTRPEDLLAAAAAMVEAGAAILDVGAMSTAPYLETRISAEEEADRLDRAVAALAGELVVPISADTSRHVPARAALEAGARIINDVAGLTADPLLAGVVAEAGASAILMASERPPEPVSGRVTASRPEREAPGSREPVDVVADLLAESLDIARAAGIAEEAIAVDPGIGFFRNQTIAWADWDVAVLAALGRLRALDRPICVAVSRKSFIGALTGEDDPARRLPGSLAAAAAAVLGGASLIRTHDVAATRQAVQVAQALRRSQRAHGAERLAR